MPMLCPGLPCHPSSSHCRRLLSGLRCRQPSDDTWQAEMTAATHRDPPCRDTRGEGLPRACLLDLDSHITAMHCAKRRRTHFVHSTTAALQLHPDVGLARAPVSLLQYHPLRTEIFFHLRSIIPAFALAAVQLCSVHAPYQPCEPCSGRHASLRPTHPSTTRHVHVFTSTPLRDAPMLLTLTRDAMQLGV